MIHNEVRSFAFSLLDLLYPPEEIFINQWYTIKNDKESASEKISKSADQQTAMKDYDELIGIFQSFQEKWNLRTELFPNLNEVLRRRKTLGRQ